MSATMLPVCSEVKEDQLAVEVYETAANGHQLQRITECCTADTAGTIRLKTEKTFQTITGFGGSFTQASAYLLNRLSPENRTRILEAYFGESGAKYALTRTHINSCDFSIRNYAYAPVPGDRTLEHFSIDEDRRDLIPMIKDAMAVSQDGFRIIASPWTAPPWMKDNNDWRGGKLIPEYYETWALYFSKYLVAYREAGIPIWGITVENEPLGNDCNWESMHYTPREMNDFVSRHLGPRLRADGHEVKILGYDQNRGEELREWVNTMYGDDAAASYFAGTAVHWYASTYEFFPDNLQYAHAAAPDKHLIQSEACVDAEVPRWQDDQWYWSREATDWGWDWAPEADKYLHPKYVPVYRYARDIIGCLNNWVDGWIDWNMVLDRKGGPNWSRNWCVAPVIVDPENDEIYFTPIYYTLSHFSRYIRPGAQRIDFENTQERLQVTAAKNPDGSLVAVVLNEGETPQGFHLILGEASRRLSIRGQAIQTILISTQN
ncbi:glycoside hydrolase family 30 protein [Flavilitoribacter nigricans]|uniref:Glycosyl hydrolase family 30 n=1 Tax=Flavilitoribacter nigricans (strain ATCC 23147 / DSM 23189 / NBRC 102662 / NCIMB 1420 / SS-2) TaxID=1122177 RepID=A0A2D0N300_FLAN2|nr:glycoside hydrolase family 30 protein [Flavilitoribacter nigricans]PHN02922.1 glycosyl hydrolase family 30 [Flavilitoribacter nigricans DSM 23189 = NBRC 102662]